MRRADEFQSLGIVRIMPQFTASPRHQAAQTGHQIGRQARAVRMRRHELSAKRRPPRELGVQIPRRIRDQAHGVLVTRLGAVGPADDAVAGHHHALGAGVGRHIIAQLHPQRIAGAFPWQPADLAAPDFLRRRLAAAAGRQCDDRIGMHMVNMRKGQQAVQRRVNAGGAPVQVKRAMRQKTHHFVVILGPGVVQLQPQQFILIERGKTIQLHRSNIAARSFHPQHPGCRSGQRVGLGQLGRGIAPAEIGHRQITAQQV